MRCCPSTPTFLKYLNGIYLLGTTSGLFYGTSYNSYTRYNVSSVYPYDVVYVSGATHPYVFLCSNTFGSAGIVYAYYSTTYTSYGTAMTISSSGIPKNLIYDGSNYVACLGDSIYYATAPNGTWTGKVGLTGIIKIIYGNSKYLILSSNKIYYISNLSEIISNYITPANTGITDSVIASDGKIITTSTTYLQWYKYLLPTVTGLTNCYAYVKIAN